MKKLPERISVPVPSADGARERVERRLFEALQNAPWRAPVETGPRPERPSHRRWWALGALAAATAVALVVVRLDSRPQGTSPPDRVSVISTGPGQGTRVALGDALVDVGEDARVAVRSGPDGATVLELSRGVVDCDVEPRPGRRPFRVEAGAVRVEVLGTRFTVRAKGDAVRVDVARGQVLVSGSTERAVLTAGQTWSSPPLAAPPDEAAPRDRQVAPSSPTASAGAPAPTTPAAARPAVAATGVESELKQSNPEVAFARAQELERRDPEGAAEGYRTLARRRDTWAALALYSLAELEIGRRRGNAALEVLSDYERRFPQGENRQDVAWLRVEALVAAGQTEAAAAAAADYLARYPGGPYVEPARRVIRGTGKR